MTDTERLQAELTYLQGIIRENAVAMRTAAERYATQSTESEAAVDLAINRAARIARAAAAIELRGMALGFRLTADWLEAIVDPNNQQQKDTNNGNDERNLERAEPRDAEDPAPEHPR